MLKCEGVLWRVTLFVTILHTVILTLWPGDTSEEWKSQHCPATRTPTENSHFSCGGSKELFKIYLRHGLKAFTQSGQVNRQTHTHTLAQNCHCELWSGVYPTCKNSPVHLRGMGVRSEGKSQCSFWLKVAEAFSSNKIRLRKPCRKWWTKNGVEVLGLSLFPCQKAINIDSRHVTVINRDILVSCMELRWPQPCSDAVAPCKQNQNGK